MKFLSKYQFHVISIGIIALVIGCLFHKPLTGEYTFGGPDSLSPSAVHQGINSAKEEYGKYPLWLPWIFSGLPSVHSFQNISDFYFPNSVIQIIKWLGFPGFWTYILHFILAGMGVFTLLSRLGTNRLSALFGGLSFALMPYLITMVVHGHGSQMMTTAWLPWVIWALLRLYDEINLANVGILGLLVGLQLQRAHAQIAYYTWMAAGLLILMMLWNLYGSNANKPKWILFTGIGLVLGLCMAMWIYFPALNYAPHSIRGAGDGGGTGFIYATAWSFSFGEMSTFFIPSFYGFGGATYWGNMPFTDYPNYMGIIVLTLAVIGAMFHESKIKWYFVITAFLALLISFGKNFFLYEIFYDFFPYFNKFRVPSMILVLTQFSVAVLAGLGLDAAIKWILGNKAKEFVKKMALVPTGIMIVMLFLKFFIVSEPGEFPKYPDEQLIKQYSAMGYQLDRIEKQIIPQYHKKYMKSEVDNSRLKMIKKDMMRLFIFLIIVVAAFYSTKNGWIGRQTLAGIIIASSIIDMGFVDWQIVEPDKNSYRQSTMIKRSLKSDYLSEDAVIKFLQSDTSKYRILPIGNLGRNRWSAFQIESIDGYHPAKLFRYNQVIDSVGWFEINNGRRVSLQTGVLQMLNVKYFIELGEPTPSALFSGELYYNGKNEKANVFLFEKFIPRAFFAEKLQNISEDSLQIQTLRKRNFDPQILSFVEHDPKDIEYSFDAKVEIVHWSPDKIEIQVDTPTNQFLVISEIYYPGGWKITSHPDWEIHAVNTILRGIYIPAGKHHIVMEFVPDDIRYGTLLTWVSSMILILFILVGCKMIRR